MNVKKIKKIKRIPGQKSIFYFDKQTEGAIISFLSADALLDKEKIYKLEIFPAIKKLIESLIFVYGFKSPLMSTAELIDEGCFFIYGSLHKWNPDKGSKAFSYFNVVAKNFLINTTNGHRKKYMKHVYLDDIQSKKGDYKQHLKMMEKIPSAEEIMINFERNKENIERVKRIKSHLLDDKDILTIQAVEKLFDSSHDIDFINKQSIYVYLVEISGLEKKQVVKSMGKIKKIYSRMLVEEKENHAIN